MRFDVCLGLPFVIQWSLCVYRRMYPPMSSLQFKEKLERIFGQILPHPYHQNRVQVAAISCFIKFCGFKAGTVKRATTLLQNELESAVTLFTTHEKNSARQVQKWVLKRATSLIKSICRNVANQVPHFFSVIRRQKVSPRGTFFVISGSNLCDFSGFFHEPQKYLSPSPAPNQ